MEKTIKELAQEALDIQSACNLSGVVHSFSRAMTELRRLEPTLGTDGYNTHPISLLYSSKIASLTGSESGLEFSRAYDWCIKNS
jgi:hypothetical protein